MAQLPPVIILCGGRATRLGELAKNQPKSMIAINNRPFIDWQLDLIRQQGIQEVILCTGHLDNSIRDHVGNGRHYNLRISYSHETEPLGTAGALRQALPLLPPTFFVCYGDSYLETDWSKIYAGSKKKKLPVHLAVYPNANQWDISNIRIAQQLRYFADPNPEDGCTHIDYGLIIFTKKIISTFPRQGDLKLALQELSTSNQVSSTIVKERFYEVGSRQGISELEAYLQNQNK